MRPHPVAHHNPVNRLQPRLGPQLPRAPDHLGIDGRPGDFFARTVGVCQKVKIDKAVVQGGDQRIGKRMRHLAQAGMRTGAVDQDEIVFLLH